MPEIADGDWALIDLQVEEDDVGEFIKHVEAVVLGLCRTHRPSELIIVRIDNWFGKRWLRFSGKILGLAGVWKSKLTLPPFVPNRVCWQRRYLYERDTETYVLTDGGVNIHRDQWSADNLQRSVAKLAPEVALFWFTGRSKDNGRGAIMAYVPVPDGHWTWYAGFAESGGWQARDLKGISRPELSDLMTRGQRCESCE